MTLDERIDEFKQRHAKCKECDCDAGFALSVIEQLQQRIRELEAAKGAEYEKAREWLLESRGVNEPCKKCSGLGKVTYGSTSTWRGGVGGQMMTSGVCDKCWGSGDATRKGADLRLIEGKQRQLEMQLTNLREALKLAREAL